MVAALLQWREQARGDGEVGAGQAYLGRWSIPVAGGKAARRFSQRPPVYAKHVRSMQKFRDTGAGELRSASRRTSRRPASSSKSNTSLVGPWRAASMRVPDRRNDHEAELRVIIGKQGSDIPKEKAYEYIAGYSLGLDMTARGQEDRSFRNRSTATPCSVPG